MTDGKKIEYEQYGVVERIENGKQNPKRGVILLTSNKTVCFQWYAAEKLEPRDIKPFSELNNRINQLSG